MGTKANPGKYDCYAKAAKDEPIFVLRANDPLAPRIVRMWAAMAESGDSHALDKTHEARKAAFEMEEWRRAKEEAAAKQEPKE